MGESKASVDVLVPLLVVTILLGMNVTERLGREEVATQREEVVYRAEETRRLEGQEVEEPAIEIEEVVAQEVVAQEVVPQGVGEYTGEVVVGDFASTSEESADGYSKGYIACPGCEEEIEVKIGGLGDKYSNEVDCKICGKRIVLGF